MKLYFKYLSIFLIFTLIFINLNTHKVKANTLNPVLVTGVADTVVLKGLISAGITIPTGAVIIGGVAATTYVVSEWKRQNPEQYEVIKTSVVNSATNTINSTVLLTDSAWSSFKTWVSTHYVVGNNYKVETYSKSDMTFDIAKNHYLPTKTPDAILRVINSAPSDCQVVRSTYFGTNDTVEAYSVVKGNYYYRNGDFIVSNGATLRTYENTSSNRTWRLVSEVVLWYEYGNSAFNPDHPYIRSPYQNPPIVGQTVVSNPTWDWNNNSTKDRSICVPESLGKLPVDSLDDVINTTASDVATGLQGKTYQDILTDTPYAPSTDIPSTDTPTSPDYSLPVNKELDFTPLKVATQEITERFPFSLPWDLKEMVNSFNVVPKAPKWTINFDSKYYKGGGSIVIDFSIFEKWALLVKWGVFFLFTGFLILSTRKLLGGD